VADTNVYRIVGTVQKANLDGDLAIAWDENDDEWLMTKDAAANIFTVASIDMFVDDEWGITLNGTWTGQRGFTGSPNLTIVDSATTHGEGGGFSVKNFKTLTDGNYSVTLETGTNPGTSPRTLTIVRNGDPIDVPVVEEDTEEWHLTGTMNGWNPADLTYPLVYNEEAAGYQGVFYLEADTMFKVLSAETEWAYARGSAHVDADDPVPAWLDIASDSAIKILTAGYYNIVFGWVASVGATINGVIIISEYDPDAVPEGYYTIEAILAEHETAKVYKTRGVVVGINGGSMFIQDHKGNAINVYSNTAIKDTLVAGNVVDAEGAFKMYNNAAELDAATVTLHEAEGLFPVEPTVIATGAELTARMGTDTTLSGQLIRLNNVTAVSIATNYPVLSFDGASITGYSFYAAAYETASTGRTALNALFATLIASGETFDIIGVLYHSSSTLGTWRLGLMTTSYVIQHPAA